MSLAWGPWAELGLAAGLNATLQARLAGQGFTMIDAAAGHERSSTGGGSRGARNRQLLVVPIDLRAAAKSFGAVVPPVWRALVHPPAARAAVAETGWAQELASMPAERKLDAVIQTVRAEVARVLSLGRAGAVPADRPLRELGLDSLMAVELRNALGRRAGADAPGEPRVRPPDADGDREVLARARAEPHRRGPDRGGPARRAERRSRGAVQRGSEARRRLPLLRHAPRRRFGRVVRGGRVGLPRSLPPRRSRAPPT